MIDGLFRHVIDPLWRRPARLLADMGLTANQVTALGLILVGANCAAFLWHGSTLILGLGLAVAFAADALDGAVARLRGESSALGGYFDAMVDRYQEAIVLISIAVVSGIWLPAMLALTGAFLTSYAKARTALEMPVDNDEWPDFFERMERLVFICGLLIVDGLVGHWLAAPGTVMAGGMWILAACTNATALQRALRARRLLIAHQRREADGETRLRERPRRHLGSAGAKADSAE